MLLSEIMSVPVATVLPTASVVEATALMDRARTRHLVVVGRGRQIVGTISANDLRTAEPGCTVESVMSTAAMTAPAGTDVRKAAKLLRGRNIGCLPVVEGGRLVGVVTTSDLLALLGKGTLHVQPKTASWTLARRGPTHRPEPRRR